MALDLRFHAIAQRPHAIHRREVADGRARRGAEAGDGRHVLRPGPAPALLAATGDEGRQLGAIPDNEGADPLGAAQLVRRQAEVVDAQRPEADRHPACGLDGVGMHRQPLRAGRLCNGSDRLHDARLVVGKLQRQEPSSACAGGHGLNSALRDSLDGDPAV